jgi:copper chaperone
MTKLSVPEMSCAHCKSAVEKAVASVDDLADLEFDMEARTVDIDSDIEAAGLIAALKTEGYEAVTI